MALILPLQIFDGLYRCCLSRYVKHNFLSNLEEDRLAQAMVNHASIFDIIRWRRVSSSFRKAADKRLQNYKRINVRMYNGLAQMHVQKYSYEWHPHATVMIVEMTPTELGIAIDTKIKFEDVRALIQVLTAFRSSVEELFMDSPVIEILINRQQVNILLDLLRNSRSSKAYQDSRSPKKQISETSFIVPINRPKHLSRLLTYAVGVEFLYENRNIDLLCLKICMGNNSQWCSKPRYRIFRHVTKFRQWSEANSLGERYFQQFSGSTTRQKQPRH